MTASMMNAYKAASLLADRDLSPEDRRILQDMDAHDVVVVQGQYDRVEQVFQLVGLKHVVIHPATVGEYTFRPEQRGSWPSGPSWRGGSLITTDWALKNVVEQAFPGFIAYNGKPTADEVVRIELRGADDPFLAGLITEKSDPLWWLEGSSYPIRILHAERVRVLITSKELGERYGEAPVAVSFDVGQGDVLHMISHYGNYRSIAYAAYADVATMRFEITSGA